MLTPDIALHIGLKTAVALGILLIWLSQKASTGAFNLFYHPLAAFPGPKVAALTAWYKTYQEVFLGRSWIDVLHELHQKYGMCCLTKLRMHVEAAY